MTRHLFISFKAAQPDTVCEAITTLGDWFQFDSGLIYLQAQVARDVAFKCIRATMGVEDKLLIIDSGDRVSVAWGPEADESELLAGIFGET